MISDPRTMVTKIIYKKLTPANNATNEANRLMIINKIKEFVTDLSIISFKATDQVLEPGLY